MEETYYGDKKKFSRRAIIIGIVAIVIALVIIYLIFGNIMVPMKVNGTSMEPTLHNDDMVYVNKLHGELDYGDIVVFNRDDAERMAVKRVLGKPNDVICVIDGKFYRNGEVVENDVSTVFLQSLRETGAPDVNDKGEFFVPKNSYFLVGDNRSNSLDSRYYGSVRGKDIVGKVLFK